MCLDSIEHTNNAKNRYQLGHHELIKCLLVGLILCIFYTNGYSQSHLAIEGTLSGIALYNHGNKLPFSAGTRYQPRVKFEKQLEGFSKIEIDFSANMLYSQSFPKAEPLAYFRPYRAFIAYSDARLEVRLGLQAISFGSAILMRPLMWFERLDARDPLQIAEGVWSGLFRYYFQNNVNLWAWVLWGNEVPKGWEIYPSDSKKPEWGGRAQFPIPSGEMAFSFNQRQIRNRNFDHRNRLTENRIGLDIKVDKLIGSWFEYSLSIAPNLPLSHKYQNFLNLGLDYTFSLGNGLGFMTEQLFVYQVGNRDMDINRLGLTLISLNYKLSMFSQIQSLVYVDWRSKEVYHFWNLSHQYKQFNFFLLFYWNPGFPIVPGHRSEEFFFTGQGVQLMFVYKHAAKYRRKAREVSKIIKEQIFLSL